MTEINLLDKSVFNRIAAGEVVDRPCSIVKELIENSIDAGATSISITVKGGGVEFIRVSDNGKGMGAEDLKTAFLPHATSKIKSIEDLDNIGTLGFRGEALPSIASVAKVTTVTRKADSEIGHRYVIDNGTETDFGEMGAPIGTTVTVEGLFDRIPARKKFLSKYSSEESAITNLVARSILSNYNVSFTYTLNGKTIYVSTGSGMENAIKTVYGDEYLPNMIKIHSTISDIVLCGYINKPSFSKHSKSFQTLIVNGRYVINDEIAYTIFGCYQKYLMTRQYPTYVLYLNLPYDLVDVNVHPGKMQIKFAMPALIKKIVVDTIEEQVMNAVAIPKTIENVAPCKTATPTPISFFETASATQIERESTSFNEKRESNLYAGHAGERKPLEKINSSILGEISEPVSVKIRSRNSETEKTFLRELSEDSFSTVLQGMFVQQEQIEIPQQTKIVGKAFNTYVFVEKGNDLYLIDQHAAHEKILYDKYVSEFERGAIPTQDMLLPYTFSVSSEEFELINSRLDDLKKIGFVLSAQGQDSFNLSAIPLCCVGLNIKNFISDFLQINVRTSKYDSMPVSFRAKLMQSACKAAVKGEDDLSEMQILSLLSQISENVTELFCPHGRPIVIKISKNEIEKWFKRIV